MTKKMLTLAISGVLASSLTVEAGTFTTANADITLSGGITGAYLVNTDATRDKFVVEDALLDLSSTNMSNGVGFNLGIGTLAQNNLASTSGTLAVIGNSGNAQVQYGWVSVAPMAGLTVDAGLIATNVGYEVAPGYANGNILRGLVWNNQPVYYTGARATYSMGGMSVYGEVNKNGGTGGAIGASGTIGGVDMSFSYFNTVNSKDIYDFIFSTKVGMVDLAANIDFQTKAKAAKVSGQDDNAYGFALYATVPMTANSTLPIRVEYVSDGTSGMYGLQYTNPTTSNLESNSAYSLTVTPTYNFSSSTFVRAELAYVSTDKKTTTYTDDKGAATDSNLVIGAQAGVLF